MPFLKLEPLNGRYCTVCLALLCSLYITPPFLQAQVKITLRESNRVGDFYQVETVSEQQGILDTVSLPQQAKLPKRLSKTGKAKSNYTEKVLNVDADQLVSKTLRRYLILEAEQKIGDDTTRAKLRPQIQLLVLDRQGNQPVTYSPDGPLLLGELEQARTDIFLSRLSGLLPSQPVARQDSWKAANTAVQELTDLQQVQSGNLDCTLQNVEGDVAKVIFFGKVTGSTPTGSNQQTITGNYLFDLKAQRLTALQFEVTSVLNDRQQKEVGSITARFQLKREWKDIADVSTAGLALETNEENTLLLVEEPRLGLQLKHSRRWVPRPVSDTSWMIDGPSGSGLTIQFEGAGTIPAAQAVRRQIEATLAKSVQGLKPLPDPTGWADAERLAWTGTQNGKEYVFEYFLWKQGKHGAIIAGRYFAPEAALAQQDVERMVRSLRRGQ